MLSVTEHKEIEFSSALIKQFDEIVTRYKEHLDKVGYDKNKLFERIIIDFLKKNAINS